MIVMFDEIMRINGRLKSLFADANAMAGLASMEATVLTAVVEARVAPTVAQIGRSLGHPRQVIQRAANELIAAKLIKTVPNPDHKRAVLLLPTAKGKSLKREADARALEAANALLRSVDSAKCERIAGELRKLRGQIEAHLRAKKA